MSTVKGSINVEIGFDEIISSGVSSGVVGPKLVERYNLLNGTSNGQINKGYYVRVTGIGASTTTQYDLIGSLTDKDGATINFDEVVLIAIKNLSTTAANYLTIGPGAANSFGVVSSNVGFWADASDKNVIAADGASWTIFHCYGGVPAAAGSTDRLDIVTQGGTSANTWDLVILGRDN